ncbi:nuclear factor NF-kappa-B p105 subunit-like [Rhopilema esculentum]|uniref:nuclear factor NF-kappa-B p105 subunit-like n=1 Tax=Rhopilema esculentum TaxID=499914 RepID=UPI0031D4C155
MEKKEFSAEIVDSGFSESYESVREGVESLTINDKQLVEEKVVNAEFQSNCNSCPEEKENGYYFEGDEEGDSLLHLAIANGKDDLALRIIDLASSASINAQNKIGQTPLMLAVITESLPVIRKLVDVGADLELCDMNGNNIIHIVAVNGIDRGLKELFTESLCRCSKELAAIYQVLLESRNAEGYTPFHLAVMNSYFGTASLLKYIGSDVNAWDYKAGFSPLHHLVKMGNAWHVQNFINEFKPNIDARSYTGITPLQLTIGGNLDDIADILIINGADTETETDECYSWSKAHLREEMLMQY